MQRRHRGIAHLHGEVAARDHDAVGSVENVVQRRDRLRALDLRHRQRPPARLVHEVARPADVRARAREGDTEEVGLERGRDLDVLHVLFGQRRRGQAATLAVDALVVRERAALFHDRGDARAAHRDDAQHDASIVQQQRVRGAHIIGQVLVIESDAVLIAQLALGIEHELRAGRERDLPLLEAADADLRSLQVHQHADGVARLARERTHQLHAPAVLRGAAVGKIHTHHVEPRLDHARERLRVARCGPERGDDLGAAEHDGRMED